MLDKKFIIYLTLSLSFAAPSFAFTNSKGREIPGMNAKIRSIQRTLNDTIVELEKHPEKRKFIDVFKRMLIISGGIKIRQPSMSTRDQNYCKTSYAFDAQGGEIVLCPSGARLKDWMEEQILIHELAHSAGYRSECLATEIAVISSNYGRKTPAFANAYLYRVRNWLAALTAKDLNVLYYDQDHCREIVKEYSFVNI